MMNLYIFFIKKKKKKKKKKNLLIYYIGNKMLKKYLKIFLSILLFQY